MIKKIKSKSEPHERLLVGYLWKNPQAYKIIKNHTIGKETFSSKKFYFLYKLGEGMHSKGVKSFDETTVENYILKSKKLANGFEKYGGYLDIESIIIDIDDGFDYTYHLDNVLKFGSLRSLYESGLLGDMDDETIDKLFESTLNEVKQYMKFLVNDSFKNINHGHYEVYDLVDKDLLYNAINELEEGQDVGIPIQDAPILNRKTKGFCRGRLQYLILESGVGKSTIARNIFIPSLIEANESFITIVNEETKGSWYVNLLITIANKKIKRKNIYKDNIMAGDFKENDKEVLREAADYLVNNYEGYAKIVVLKKYRFEDVLQVVEEHSAYGINYIVFDTFKPDNNNGRDTQRWEQFSNMSQELYDLIKPENLNIGVLATLQLKINSRRMSGGFLDHDDVGKSKEVVEVADVTMLGRKFYKDEYPPDDDDFGSSNTDTSSNEIKVYRRVKSGDTWITEPVNIDREKEYIIIFFGKNRLGDMNEQIIFEMDYERNVIKEVGYTKLRKG